MKYRIQSLMLGAALTLTSVIGFATEPFSTVVVVYKSATCSCCSGWVKHMRDNGFNMMTQNVQDVSQYKERANLPEDIRSCHTAFVDGYAIEGHVPASDIKRMLTQKPDIRGLAVPGMPIGSPGMEYGDRKDRYQVISYTKDGVKTVYSSY